jgi:hypothetical protein
MSFWITFAFSHSITLYLLLRWVSSPVAINSLNVNGFSKFFRLQISKKKPLMEVCNTFPALHHSHLTYLVKIYWKPILLTTFPVMERLANGCVFISVIDFLGTENLK